MTNGRRMRYECCFALLVLAMVALAVGNLLSGSMNYHISDIVGVLTGNVEDETISRILFSIRLPRIIAALFLGGALAVSGFLLQTFFANPIAGPFVLGISSGAKMAVALVMVFVMARRLSSNSAMLITASFCGSILSMVFILIVSYAVKNSSLLVVCGVMMGYLCSALTDFIVTFADDSNIVNLHNWSMGSFSGIGSRDVRVMSAIVTITVMVVFLLSKPMNAYQMGETYAKNLGVDIHMLRILMILLSSILSACVTAFAGPVSFVGVAVPHLVKRLFGTVKPIIIVPASFLGGAVFCLFCDLLARTMFAPTEISISSVTAVFGAPVVIWMMFRKKKERE